MSASNYLWLLECLPVLSTRDIVGDYLIFQEKLCNFCFHSIYIQAMVFVYLGLCLR